MEFSGEVDLILCEVCNKYYISKNIVKINYNFSDLKNRYFCEDHANKHLKSRGIEF